MDGNFSSPVDSNVCCFNSGFTTADLNSFGNIPDLRDRFTMRVVTEALTLIHRGNRLDGRGSDEQVDFGDEKIKFSISSTDASWKNKNFDCDLSGIVNGFKSTNGSFA